MRPARGPRRTPRTPGPWRRTSARRAHHRGAGSRPAPTSGPSAACGVHPPWPAAVPAAPRAGAPRLPRTTRSGAVPRARPCVRRCRSRGTRARRARDPPARGPDRSSARTGRPARSGRPAVGSLRPDPAGSPRPPGPAPRGGPVPARHGRRLPDARAGGFPARTAPAACPDRPRRGLATPGLAHARLRTRRPWATPCGTGRPSRTHLPGPAPPTADPRAGAARTALERAACRRVPPDPFRRDPARAASARSSDRALAYRPPSLRHDVKKRLGGARYASQPREKSRRRPTLPGGSPPSTIGAGGLHCRVRNGNGCFPAAIATGNL